MLPVRSRLQQSGWTRVDTPTWRYELSDLDVLGARAAAHIESLSADSSHAPVDIVSHSMGGLVTRAALRHAPPVGRIVMLAPPNQGARMAEAARTVLPFHRLGWDPLAPLLPGAPDDLPDGTDVEIGVLTGGRGHRHGYNPLLGGDNDGKVRVDEAALPGATDFLVLPAHHTFVMAWPAVLSQVVHFLQTGAFLRETSSG